MHELVSVTLIGLPSVFPRLEPIQRDSVLVAVLDDLFTFVSRCLVCSCSLDDQNAPLALHLLRDLRELMEFRVHAGRANCSTEECPSPQRPPVVLGRCEFPWRAAWRRRTNLVATPFHPFGVSVRHARRRGQRGYLDDPAQRSEMTGGAKARVPV